MRVGQVSVELLTGFSAWIRMQPAVLAGEFGQRVVSPVDFDRRLFAFHRRGNYGRNHYRGRRPRRSCDRFEGCSDGGLEHSFTALSCSILSRGLPASFPQRGIYGGIAIS